MAAGQYIHIPNYHAIIFRRTYADLALPGAIMDRSKAWFSGTDARWSETTKTWTFPSGATITFGYLEAEVDKYRYQGSEFQFCVARGTKIVMGDGTLKRIELIEVGEKVQTLEGPRMVTETHHPGVKWVVDVVTKYGTSRISEAHRILLRDGGWASPLELQSRQYCSSDSNVGVSSLRSQVFLRQLLHLSVDRRQLLSLAGLDTEEKGHFDYGVLLKDGQSGFLGSGDGCEEALPRRRWSAHLRLSLQALQLAGRAFQPHDGGDVLELSKPPSCLCDYHSDSHSCGGQLRLSREAARDGTPSQGDAEEQNRSRHLDDLVSAQRCSHRWYTHPYTSEVSLSVSELVDEYVDIVPAGEEEVFDLTVASASHYILSTGIVSSNCGFDELTQFTETQYTYLFSRLRSTVEINVPLRMRAASNPGGLGHIWVKRRFIDQETRRSDSVFIPARVRDNPSLNADEYIHSLNYLDPITRARYLDGDWTVSDGGKKFKREWFEIVDTLPVHLLKVCYWDLAATEPNGENDPDYTAACVIGRSSEDIYYITSIVRTRSTPRVVEALVKQTAQLNGVSCSYVMEQEPGSSGVNTIDYYTRIMAGFWFTPNKTTGSKSDRSNPLASQAEAGNVKLLKGSWNADFLDELEIFPEGPHDDQVDAASGAFEFCAKRQWMSVYQQMKSTGQEVTIPSADDGYNQGEDTPSSSLDGFRSRG